MERLIYCKYCGRSAEEHREAVILAAQENLSPSEWVRENERLTPDGQYYDTVCYILADTPLW